ncbi:LPXTG cell wall anchor domain-containing protein [Staphylococcus cohnii]|uniref:LPXTG cell wall anchor domain-containing protein n=1 Tax=Staphylococcus cohnii TaxID=29382 RepID=UPI003D7C61BD
MSVTSNPPNKLNTLNTSNVSSTANTTKVSASTNTTREKQLPNTGETNNTGFFASIIALIGGIILTVSRRKKN